MWRVFALIFDGPTVGWGFMVSPAIESLRLALSGRCLRRSISVALVVGTVLNAINQWEAFFGDATVAWTKLLLTYCVPFCVSTYGMFSVFAGQRSGR